MRSGSEFSISHRLTRDGPDRRRPTDAGDLAASVSRGLASLLRHNDDVRWPSNKTPVGSALWGSHRPRSPSLVWASQAVEVLLAYDHRLDDPLVAKNVAVIANRLAPDNYASPETTDPDDERFAWVLRVRHLGWVLRCVFPSHLRAPLGDATSRDLAAERAFRLLAGDLEAGEAATWAGIRDGERFWSEHWAKRRQNVLNNLYCAWAVCRASRFGITTKRSWTGGRTPEGTVANLLASISVESAPAGPRARFHGSWVEPWAAADLPCSVVGLTALLLREHAQLLLEAPDTKSDAHEAAGRSLDLARRLGHELISRSDDWVEHVDAFSYAGAEGGWWFIPSFSVCVQALLQTGVAGPRHEAVLAAFKTIKELAREGRDAEGLVYQTWIDPTRGDIRHHLTEDDSRCWYGSVPLSRLSNLEHLSPTAGSIHACAMAWSAMRDALRESDPHSLFSDRRTPKVPESPFERIVVEPSNGNWLATLATPAKYYESTKLRHGVRYLLEAVARLDRPATSAEIAHTVNKTAPRQLGRLTRTDEGVRAAVRELNKSFGVALVTSQSSDSGVRHQLTSQLRFRGRGHIVQRHEQLDAILEWDVIPGTAAWSGDYELADREDPSSPLTPGKARVAFPGGRVITVQITPADAARGRFSARGNAPQI